MKFVVDETKTEHLEFEIRIREAAEVIACAVSTLHDLPYDSFMWDGKLCMSRGGLTEVINADPSPERVEAMQFVARLRRYVRETEVLE